MNSHKNLLFKATRISGLHRLTRKLKKGAVALFYHGVAREIIDPPVQGLHLLFSQFERQIQYVRKNFTVISIDELDDAISHNHRTDRSHVLLTFDDGYRNILNLVAPFLRSYDLSFTVFISTRHIETGQRFPTYYLRAAIFNTKKKEFQTAGMKRRFGLDTEDKRFRAVQEIGIFMKRSSLSQVKAVVEDLVQLLSQEEWAELSRRYLSDEVMNWEDIGKLGEFGGTVGSHCHDHFVFNPAQDHQEVENQLKVSYDQIKGKTGSCKYLAYPEGKLAGVPPEFIRAVRASQYRLAFSVQPGEITLSADPYILPRVGAPNDFDKFVFVLNNSHVYNRRYDRMIQDFT